MRRPVFDQSVAAASPGDALRRVGAARPGLVGWRASVLSGLGVVTIALGFTSLAFAETVPAAVATSSITCGSDHLSVSWRGTTGGLAGHSGDLFWIHNTGEKSCVLRGYPIVRFDVRGHRAPLTSTNVASPLGRPTGWRGGPPPTVHLAPGRVASFWVVGSDVVTPCRALSSMVVVVRPLRGRAIIDAPSAYGSWPFCGSGVTVSPILAGLSGSVPEVPVRRFISFGP